MRYFSTRNLDLSFSAREVCLLGLAPDGGLFLPRLIPRLPLELLLHPEAHSLESIATEIAAPYFAPELEKKDVGGIVEEVLSFPIPLRHVAERIFSLELYHGPTLAFKDFGAMFLARVLSRLWRGEGRELTVLVATSGDTGGAVAAGFAGVPGVRVVILYPSGRVSPLQEKQMTTLGGNISALEVEGSFDDCQKLVKAAFADADLRMALPLTSANSINFARLLPQTFYYIEGLRQVRKISGMEASPVVYSVPSGNLGNLCAGVLAKKSGFDIQHFLLAANRNRAAVDYLQDKTFSPRASERTLSNAMDVGNPSNLERLIALYESHGALTDEISGSSWNEEETRTTLLRVYQDTGYLLDPHGAVGYAALETYLRNEPEALGIVLETAHPAKFLESVEPVIGTKLEIPKQMAEAAKKEKISIRLPAEYGAVRDALRAL